VIGLKVAIFGLGYVGCTVMCCIAESGHDVLGVDISARKVADINAGIAPFSEPRIGEMLRSGLDGGRIRAITEVPTNLDALDLAIVCVGTPSGPDGAHDMSHIAEVTRQIAGAVGTQRAKPLTVAYRSTMRPGTMQEFVSPIFAAKLGAQYLDLVELVYNPEFLRESVAVSDYFDPPKIVVGTYDGKPCTTLATLHQGIAAPVFHTGYREAEFTKFVDNSWHAVKVGFANEIGRVAETLGVSATQVHEIFVADTKLNISAYYMRPGGPFGGSCLPKDVRALTHMAAKAQVAVPLLSNVISSNDAHRRYQSARVLRTLSVAPRNARVLLVGLAFKQGTDDLRESPNVDLANDLLEAGVALSIHDPALDPARLQGRNLGYAYAHLSRIDQLLIDAVAVESGDWDLVVACNATVDALNLGDQAVLRTYEIP